MWACLYVRSHAVVCFGFAAGGSVGNSRQHRVFGPVGTGPRLERRSQRWDLGSFPLHRLFASKRAPPERGQMLRRAGVRPLASVFQTRPASPDRGHGIRLSIPRALASLVRAPFDSRKGQHMGSLSEYAVFLGSAFGASRAL